MFAKHLADEQKGALFINSGCHGEQSIYRQMKGI
jgi:hypothetical protein